MYFIVNFRFWIGGIAALYPLVKQAEFPEFKFRIPNSKISDGPLSLQPLIPPPPYFGIYFYKAV
jgi:hypothetical protein